MIPQQPHTFKELFEQATGKPPYPYQERLAGEGSRVPSLISIPTGAGKTAAISLAWLFRRFFHPDQTVRQNTPRRLVYCLPMRVLTEQTRNEIVTWLDRLKMLEGKASFDYTGRLLDYNPFGETLSNKGGVRVHLLMGGDIDRDWDRFPEQESILVGTQDQLISRALNRGYATSRFRWPLQFGLLHSDVLWVFDEVQLMGNGLATSLQLQGFRDNFGCTAQAQSVWMSATVHPDWLKTIDAPTLPASFELSDIDKTHASLKRRYTAFKEVRKVGFDTDKKGKAEADLALKQHREGTLTLLVVNTVKRAQEIYSALEKELETRRKRTKALPCRTSFFCILSSVPVTVRGR